MTRINGSTTVQPARSQPARPTLRSQAPTSRPSVHDGFDQPLQSQLNLGRPVASNPRPLAAAPTSGPTPTPTPPLRTFDTPEAFAAFCATAPKPLDLRGAKFNFPVDLSSPALVKALTDKLPAGTRIDTIFLGANLAGASFNRGVSHLDLMATNLTGATFKGPVDNVTFLYANLTNADFSGADHVRNTDFAFTTTTGLRLPPKATLSGDVFTGTPLGTEPLLNPATQLNSPAVLAALTGTSDPAAQKALIRQWAQATSAPTLLDRLAGVLPKGALDGLLPREWRSRLYDHLHADRVSGKITDADYWANKPFIFDAVDGRYGPYPRPTGGPTLQALAASSPLLEGYINQALGDMLTSDAPLALTQAYGGAAPPAASGELSRLARDVKSAGTAGGAGLDAWLDRTFDYNAQAFSVRNTNLDPAAIKAARDWLAANHPDLLPRFDGMAADGLLTMQNLLDAGMRDVVQDLFATHY